MESTSSKETDHDKNTLYIGNLALKTTDSEVYRIFNSIGPLKLVKVIRPNNEHFFYKPTCYAYVSYINDEDAAKAIKRINFFELHGAQIRVMYCNKSNYKNESANVIVKNLPLEVDDKTLFDTFKIFGSILSAKVSMNNGVSRGYGYIQFIDKLSAKKCIKLGSGTKLINNIVKIEKFKKKTGMDTVFTNVYIKNFPLTMKEEDLKGTLLKYGEINSFHFPLKENGEPKGFAHCNFVNPESAKSATTELHNSSIFNLPELFYVQRAQSKTERDFDIKSMLSKLSLEGKQSKRNLYVTNIPSDCTEELLKKTFGEFGKIVSVSMEKDATKEKEGFNFAYVCFSTPEEARVALDNAPKIVLNKKTPIITLFKSKKDREYERDHTNYFYNNSINQNTRTNPFFEKRPESSPDFRLKEDLYKQLFMVANTYEEKWSNLGVKSKSEFAEIVTNLLLKKPKNEIRNMIELTNILMDNVSNALNDYSENTKNISESKYSKK